MEDKCLFCGADVSDLDGHVCKSCIGKCQSHLLSRKLRDYQLRYNRALSHSRIYIRKLGELHWYQWKQREYLEKILRMYEELLAEYKEIINLLEAGLKYGVYKSVDGNAKVEKVEQEFEQLTLFDTLPSQDEN